MFARANKALSKNNRHKSHYVLYESSSLYSKFQDIILMAYLTIASRWLWNLTVLQNCRPQISENKFNETSWAFKYHVLLPVSFAEAFVECPLPGWQIIEIRLRDLTDLVTRLKLVQSNSLTFAIWIRKTPTKSWTAGFEKNLRMRLSKQIASTSASSNKERKYNKCLEILPDCFVSVCYSIFTQKWPDKVQSLYMLSIWNHNMRKLNSILVEPAKPESEHLSSERAFGVILSNKIYTLS